MPVQVTVETKPEACEHSFSPDIGDPTAILNLSRQT